MTGVGAPVVAAAVAALLAAALAGRRRRSPLGRLARSQGAPPSPPGEAVGRRRADGGPTRWRRMAAATAALVGAIAVLGATHGAVVGTGLAVATLVVRHRDARSGADPVAVPLVVDLIAGCLSAGVPMPDALDAVTAVDPGELSARCRATAAALRAGAPADEAWADWLADPWLAPVARTTLRSSLTGAATAADLRRTATRLRSRRRAAELARVRRASVWVVVPLGLCFLPAFVLVAVVPLVAGLLPTFR